MHRASFWPLPRTDGMSNGCLYLLQWSTEICSSLAPKLSHNSQIVKMVNVKAQKTSLYLFLETWFFGIIKEEVVHSPCFFIMHAPIWIGIASFLYLFPLFMKVPSGMKSSQTLHAILNERFSFMGYFLALKNWKILKFVIIELVKHIRWWSEQLFFALFVAH